MDARLFQQNQHEGYRLANQLMSIGPDTGQRMLENLLEVEDGINQIAAAIDYLQTEYESRKRAAEKQHYNLAILLSDIDESSTITATLNKEEYDEITLNGKYRADNDKSFMHEITKICYSENYHSAAGIVAKYCDDKPYVWVTFIDRCAAEARLLADACQAQISCEQLIKQLQSILKTKSNNTKQGEYKY